MKKTLLIANACFSDEEANGRTLKNLFSNAETEKLAQFFVYGNPDFSTCNRYYRVTDHDALYSIFMPKKAGGEVLPEAVLGDSRQADLVRKPATTKKTPLMVLCREVIWRLGWWKNKRLWKWIDDFNPEIIFLFIANNTFLIRLAKQISKKYRIPVVIYSTEGYSFMDFNYLTNKPSAAYMLYYKWLQSEYRKVAPYVTKGFLNNTLLQKRYEEEYGYPCCCIMNSSRMTCIPKAGTKKYADARISYLGNLGLNRHKALIELACALHEIDSDLFLDIYGEAPNSEIQRELQECRSIKFHGLVSYNEVTQIIHQSDLLVHAEHNDEITNRDLRYAFSTKIADSLCSGIPFLIYANEKLAETSFLIENDCAFVALDRNSLAEILRLALTNEEQREKKLENAKIVKEKFLTGNRELMQMLE